jgi:hypothetical protein
MAMKLVALVTVFLASAVSVAFGATGQADAGGLSKERVGSCSRDSVEKWSQLPDVNGNLLSSYYNINQAVLYQCADDFYCADGAPIVSVQWWGVDMSWEIWYFKVRFYANVSGPPFAHPGASLYEQTLSDFTAEDLPGGWGTRYSVELPVPFEQEAGNTYWVSVVAHVDEGHTHAAEWYWFECVSTDCWGSTAVQRTAATDWAPVEEDLAFVLTASEPSPVEEVGWSHIKAMFR